MESDLIEVRLPASANHLPVVRALAAELAARLDFNLDEIDDLRMAVDEAGATLVADVGTPATLYCSFRVLPHGLVVTTRAHTRSGKPPADNTFGWRVLVALVDEVRAAVADSGEVEIELTKVRGAGA